MNMSTIQMIAEPAGQPPTAFERSLLAAHAWQQRFEQLLEIVAFIALLFAMALISADTLGRYAFHAPVRWATESLQQYVLPAIFFFGLGVSIARRGHVAVEMLVSRAPVRLQQASGLLGSLLGVLLFGLILTVSAQQLQEVAASGEVNPGVFDWPVWPTFALCCAGCLVATLRLALMSVLQFAAMVGFAPALLPLVDPVAHEVFE
jgi:TRAP-type C4-dicarboxylate transport system permease small subunit